jgi:hypothetical protein
MAITRTYSVGQNNRARRLDNHTLPWIDISPFGDGWEIYDVMSDPNDPDKVTIVGEEQGGLGGGILTSTNAGVTWSIPNGNWNVPKIWYEVWYVDSNTIWAVGQLGNVAKSIDGGLTFNLTTLIQPVQSLTNAIHAISDQVAVVVESRAPLTNNTVCKVWKTIDGGFSWVTLNGGLNLFTTVQPPPPAVGYGESIWISDDQQTIIVGTSGTQNVSTDFGATFNSIIPEMVTSGRHLTWYPSYGDPDFFRHVGGPDFHLMESTDTGTTFVNERSGENIEIRGAQFYSAYNGYYIQGRTVFFTTDGGVTGTVSEIVPGVERMNAVWTGTGPTIYRLVDCTGAEADRYSTSALLSPMVGLVVNITIPSTTTNTCWQVEISDEQDPPLTFITGVTVFDDCISCLPEPANDICWDLISCNGQCNDLLSVSGLTFLDPPLPGSLYTINGDPTCVYELYPIRQAIFKNLQTEDLSDPLSNFQLGTDNITLEISSIIYNNVEQVTTPFTYLLSPSNYQVVECVGLNCTIVPVDTTENCVDNTQLFFNNVISSLGIPMEAYSDDPEHCGFGCGGPKHDPDGGKCTEMFRLQYRDGDTFAITINITSNAGTSSQLLEVQTGNLSIQNNLINGNTFETCNADVYCPPVSQPLIQSIDPWLGDCPPLPAPPEIGKACEIKPRLGEPGFATKHCDPKKVVSIKTSYADSVFALFKRLRYGIETCCEFDLDKIDIKNMLLDLGDIYDPDLCVSGQPVPNGCCPQPTNAVVNLLLPVDSCPVPIDVTVIIELPIPPCPPPVDATVGLVIL